MDINDVVYEFCHKLSVNSDSVNSIISQIVPSRLSSGRKVAKPGFSAAIKSLVKIES